MTIVSAVANTEKKMLGIIDVGHFYRARPVASRRRWRAAHNACVSERIKRSGETTDHVRGESLSNYDSPYI